MELYDHVLLCVDQVVFVILIELVIVIDVEVALVGFIVLVEVVIFEYGPV